MTQADYVTWRNLIGDFIMEFTRVEDELDHMICDSFPNEYEGLASKMFKLRASYVVNNIDSVISDHEITKVTKRALSELIQLSDNVRNMIAHYPLEMTLESILSENPSEEIRSRRKREKVVTFDKLDSSFKNLLKWSQSLKDVSYSISCRLCP